MVFVVMLPMVTGPFIGQGVSNINGTYALNQFGEMTVIPNEYIFLFAIIIIALTVIPLLFLQKKEKENNEQSTTK